ncbi:hypothetical protein V1264_002180 [Littorina saxatilis]|uniref:Uncharacterized protein n=2 Tax=Littorina saxatilis TaxID=31220 RepID=A0AAN9C2X0_9CAEN
MASTRRRERELVAVAFNQKEQRVLEKSIATIKLEASYSLKLLDLSNRTVKVHFRQLKDRVSRIKSYLTPEEIQKLRRLESEGKLHPMYPPVSLGSALKIAAAARRLHSSHAKPQPAPPTRAKSALPRFNLPGHAPGTSTPPPGALKRSNSVTGVFIDAPPPRGVTRPGSASVTIGRTSPTPEARVSSGVIKKGTRDILAAERGQASDSRLGSRLQVNGGGVARIGASGVGRPGSSEVTMPESRGVPRPGSNGLRVPTPSHLQQQNGISSSSSSMDSHVSKRSNVHPHSATTPVTDHHHPKRPDSHIGVNGHGYGLLHAHGQADAARSRRNSSSTGHSRATTSHSHAPFSSHVATEKEAREREENGEEAPGGQHGLATTPRSHHSAADRNASTAGLSDDTVDDLGEDLHAERRAELLEEEQYRATVINKRKDRFLLDIDRYLKENPPLRSLPITPKASPQEGGADNGEAQELDAVAALGGALFRRRRVEFDSHPTYLPEVDYKDRLMGLWRDMNKCRYLRVPDEMIDLSGVNTLATDTMKLYQALKHSEVEALPSAWGE